nr:hypothetical protein [Ruminococcus sp.]
MEKKISKKEAVIFTVAVVVIMLLVGTVLIAVGAEQLSWIGIVVAGIAGVLFFCKETGEKLDLREKIRSFDITVPLMIFLMSWSLCTVASYIYGLIASRFSSVGANEKQFRPFVCSRDIPHIRGTHVPTVFTGNKQAHRQQMVLTYIPDIRIRTVPLLLQYAGDAQCLLRYDRISHMLPLYRKRSLHYYRAFPA